MIEAIRITDFEHPDLAPYRSMRMQSEHQAQGIFVAEGEKVVRRLLESSLEVISVLLPTKWVQPYEPLLATHPSKPKLFTAEKTLLEKLTGFSLYQGLLAVGKIPPPLSLPELVKGQKTPALLVAVEGISSAENMGALIRSCAAFGAQGLVVGESCCHPYLRRSVRASMGTIFNLPYLLSPNVGETLQELKREKIQAVAADPKPHARVLNKADFASAVCIVFGSEGAGISESTLAACDYAAQIPMQNEVDSLNVSSAAAAFLYEVWRQRSELSSQRDKIS